MKKIALLCLILLLPVGAMFAQSITSVEGTAVTVAPLQSGNINLKTDKNEIILSQEQRTHFIEILKAHAGLLTDMTTEKIVIKASRYTGKFQISLVDSVDFWVYINNYKDKQYVLEINFDNKTREAIAFDLDKLNALIKEFENTKATTETYRAQVFRVDELIARVKSTL